MAALLSAILICSTVFAYRRARRDFLSPWFLMCFAITAMFAIVLLNYENWQVNINGKFVLYIATAIVSFGVGCALITKFSRYGKAVRRPKPRLPLKSVAPTRVRYPAGVLAMVSAITVSIYVLKLILDAGGGSVSEVLNKIYMNIVREDYSPGIIFNQMREIATAIAYISVYRFFLKSYLRRDKVKYSVLLVPIVLFLIMVLFTTDRNVLLRFVIFTLCVWVFLYLENHSGKKAVQFVVLVAIITVAISAIVFFMYGKLKGYQSDIWRSLSIYGGSGLYNFNLWLDMPHEPLQYGMKTFNTLFSTIEFLLKPLGVNFNLTNTNTEAFIIFAAPNGYVYSSNVYSAFFPFVTDFGYFGMILFPLIEGLFFQWLYCRMKTRKYGFSLVLYCMLIYPVIYMPIADQLFLRFTLGFIYEWFWLYVIYIIAFGKKASNGVNCRVQRRGAECYGKA